MNEQLIDNAPLIDAVPLEVAEGLTGARVSSPNALKEAILYIEVGYRVAIVAAGILNYLIIGAISAGLILLGLGLMFAGVGGVFFRDLTPYDYLHYYQGLLPLIVGTLMLIAIFE